MNKFIPSHTLLKTRRKLVQHALTYADLFSYIAKKKKKKKTKQKKNQQPKFLYPLATAELFQSSLRGLAHKNVA